MVTQGVGSDQGDAGLPVIPEDPVIALLLLVNTDTGADGVTLELTTTLRL